MANKKFTPEEIAILKANPYVMEVTEDIIHFSASFKSSFWDRLQNGMKPPDIFRELGIDPNILGPTRVISSALPPASGTTLTRVPASFIL